MKVGILNSEGLVLSSVVDYLPVHEYELFGEIPDINGSWGVFLDLNVLLEEVGVIDEDGVRLMTPCPSHSKEWSKAVDLAMKDLKKQVCSHPDKVWLPGATRPLFCNVGSDDDEGYFFACSCPDCNSDKDIETVQNLTYLFEDYTKQEIGRILADSKDMHLIINRRCKLNSKFDKAMKQAVHRHFPGAEVALCNTLTGGYIPETFNPSKGYSVHPSMVRSNFQGELILESLEDFQLAAVLFENVNGILLHLPNVIDEDYDFSDSELGTIAAEFFGARQDLRYTAERFLNAIFAGGEVIA